MGLLECASDASVCRGYEYYKSKHVTELQEDGNDCYNALVTGSQKEPYHVHLELGHPRKSTCTCPHAAGKRIICKHIIATYFAVLPQEAETFYQQYLRDIEEEEQYEEELYEKVRSFVCQMKKDELQSTLLELIFDGPEWQFDKFVRENGLDE